LLIAQEESECCCLERLGGVAAAGSGCKPIRRNPDQPRDLARRAASARWAKNKRWKDYTHMALSPKMLAVIQKVDAAEAEYFAGLKASAERDAEHVRAQKAAKKTQAATKPAITKPPTKRGA